MDTQKSKPRILLVVPFTKPDYSGSGINALNFAGFLTGLGYKAEVLTFNRNLQYKSREIIDEVPVIRIAYLNRNMLAKIISLFYILPVYAFHILRTKIIILYGAHIIAYQFILILSRIFCRVTVFRSLLLGADDMSSILSRKNSISAFLHKSMFKNINHYFAINPEFSARYINWIGPDEKIFLSPQGVNTEIFKPLEKDKIKGLRKFHEIGEETLVILSVGFLINRKGYSGAFEALSKLVFDFRYIVAGEYEFGQNHFMLKYSDQASELYYAGQSMLGERLFLTGPVENMMDYYQIADIVLINSSSEGLPNTMLEAMACGKVVLVRDIPGISYLVDHLETGVVYRNKDELIESIMRLHQDPELRDRLGKNAAERIKAEASFSVVWDRLIERL